MSTWKSTRTLYVVLQGEFALYHLKDTDDDKILIMAPDVPDHVYKAGPWLSDWSDHSLDLPDYRETGKPVRLLHAGGDRKEGGGHSCRAIPEKNSDIFIQPGKATVDKSKARVVIEAPMPLAILPGRRESNKDAVIQSQDQYGGWQNVTLPPQSTIIPILVYKWYEDETPYLSDGDTHWRTGGPNEYFRSIHLYASGATAASEDSSHAREAFTLASRLIGIEAKIVQSGSETTPIFATPPAGLSWAQVNLMLYQVILAKNYPDLLVLDGIPHRTGHGEAQTQLGVILGGGGSGGDDCGPVTGQGS